MTKSMGPFAGLIVVDFTHIIAGPYCTQLLADGGAEVIKVEPPGGDWARNRGPRRPTPDGGSMSAYFSAMNRGKQSIVLDLKNSDGNRIARDLIAKADICIWNFSSGTMDRLGLGVDVIRERHRRLITTSITLLGDTAITQTPTRPGLAIVAESESSHSSMHRDASGRPIRGDLPVGDMCTAMATYGAITTALFERERTGQGRHIDISMVLSLMVFNSTGVTGEQLKPPGIESSDIGTAGYGLFMTADGFVAVGVNSDRLFRRLAEVMGRPELADDPRFASFIERDRRFREVDLIIAEWCSSQTRQEVFAMLNEAGVPAGIVNTPGDVLSNEIFRDLHYFEAVDDGFGTQIDVPANPFGLRCANPVIPGLGEHRNTVLAEHLGLSRQEVVDLALSGAFGPAET